MGDDGFKSFLARHLGARSVSSYLSNCRRVERQLGVDLQTCDLSPHGVAAIRDQLQRRHGEAFTEGSLSDCLTAVRRYAEFRAMRDQNAIIPAENSARKPGLVDVAAAPAAPTSLARSDIVKSSSVRDLLVLHGTVMEELRERGVVRTGNGPLGDYAEHLFASAFGWALEANSSSGHDAQHDGVRYQIKSRRITHRNRSRQLGAIRKLGDRTFDVLAGALFDDAYRVTHAILIPYEEVAARAKRVEHTNSWRLMLEDWWWQLPGTQDVTAELRAAAGGI